MKFLRKKVEQRPPELDSHSFIVKIWVEETTEKGAASTWRGHITHVPEGTRQPIRRLREITRFIASYLSATGVSTGAWQSIKRWLHR